MNPVTLGEANIVCDLADPDPPDQGEEQKIGNTSLDTADQLQTGNLCFAETYLSIQNIRSVASSVRILEVEIWMLIVNELTLSC